MNESKSKMKAASKFLCSAQQKKWTLKIFVHQKEMSCIKTIPFIKLNFIITSILLVAYITIKKHFFNTNITFVFTIWVTNYAMNYLGYWNNNLNLIQNNFFSPLSFILHNFFKFNLFKSTLIIWMKYQLLQKKITIPCWSLNEFLHICS